MIINPYIYGVATSYDADAQLFFNAQTGAGVTLTTTQMDAVNQWVVDSKAIGIWTKMKAVYPMVGGTATSHKFNLKNPLDADAAFRLNFIGGWIHSSNGALPNGTNAYANTFCTTANMALNSVHHSFYSRTDQVAANAYEMGVYQTTPNCNTALVIKTQTGAALFGKINNSGTGTTSTANSNSTGFYITSRTASNLTKTFKNNSLFQTATQLSGAVSTNPYFISANNNLGSPSNYSLKESAFITIGDGLTDLELQLFYQITEKYQVALSRNVNTLQSFYYNAAYNNETNAFLFSTQITDNTIQTATDTLVSDLKTANIFTKMKAIYPMVGGTATTHKFNLVNAQDTNAAYRLSFIGGWTHSANGALPNGTNAYAETYISPNAAVEKTLCYYSRTSTVGSSYEIGNYDNGNLFCSLRAAANFIAGANSTGIVNFTTTTNAQGFWLGTRRSDNNREVYRNAVSEATSTLFNSSGYPNNNIVLAAVAVTNGQKLGYSAKECAFAAVGDFGLSDAEALALYNAVNAFQVSLARNV